MPTCKLGRIGLDLFRKNPNVVFAVIDTERAGEGRPPTNAYLGVQGEDAPNDGGAKITQLTSGGPAAKAGLAAGDIVKAIDGADVVSYSEFASELVVREPGSKVKLSVLRGKDAKEIEATMIARPGTETKTQPPRLGVQTETVAGGVKLTGVTADWPGAKAGLLADDVLTSLDGKPLPNADAITAVLAGKKVGDKIKATYLRGPDKKEVEIALAGPPAATAATRPYIGMLAGMIFGGNQENVQRQQGPDGFQTGGVYKSADGGESWTRVNSLNPRPFYFSTVRVDPSDENTVYLCGIKLWRSNNGGRTFGIDDLNEGLHDDQHALWIDPRDGRHLLVGCDGGFYASYDRGHRWDRHNHAGRSGSSTTSASIRASRTGCTAGCRTTARGEGRPR